MNAKLRKLFLLLVWIGVAAYLFKFGVRVEGFIFFSIAGILVFFYHQLYLDKKVAENDKLKNSSFVYSGLLLISIYVVGMLCLKHAILPSKERPYYNNTFHHGLSNNGIAFNNNLVLTSAAEQSGIFEAKSGQVAISANANGGQLQFNNYKEPIFIEAAKTSKKILYTPANNIFKKPIGANTTISNGITTLTILNCKLYDDANFIQRWADKSSWQIDIQCALSSTDTAEGATSNIVDTFRYMGAFEKGLQLKELVLKAGRQQHESAADAPSAGIMHSLGSLGNIYLLSNFGASSPSVTLFPDEDFFENNFQLSMDGQVQNPTYSGSVALANKQRFFLGFYNKGDAVYLDAATAYPTTSFKKVLRFEFAAPKYFSTSTPSVAVGATGQMYIANHYSQLLQQGETDGFLMHEVVKPATQNLLDAQLYYTVGRPSNALQLSVKDLNNASANSNIQNNQFALRSRNGSNDWLFEVHNFADNNYSLTKQWMYLSVILLLILATLLFNPGHNLKRIEAPIWAVLFVLFAIRHLMLWRLVTFPPVKNIRMQEYQNLFKFDSFSLFGTQWPIGFVFVVGFIALLNLYRYWNRKNLKPLPLNYFSFISFGKSPFLQKHREVLIHAIILVVAAIACKFLPIEILKRVCAIFIPLLSYLAASYSLFFKNENELLYNFQESETPWIKRIDQFLKYWIETPHFFLSLITILFFAIIDRGFGVMFILFLIFKNTVYSFLRKAYKGEKKSIKDLLTLPENYWMYSILFAAIYIVIIGIKQTFYYLLLYKIFILGVLSLAIGFYLYKKFGKVKNNLLKVIPLLVLGLMCFVPPSHKMLDDTINDQLKYVRYRAPILFMPVEKIIADIEFNSFDENKVIETAESQWFINSYLQRDFSYDNPINLQPHFNRGVDFITQTRDLVLPRYVISELGRPTMIGLLLLLAIPALLFFVSYTIDYNPIRRINFTSSGYVMGSAALLLLTLAFFVWLTATNRFVFFGQDFPFLSLTSKVAVLIPLALFWVMMTNKPIIKEINTEQKVFRRTFLLPGIIVLIVIISGGSKILNSEWFSIKMTPTEIAINSHLNNLLSSVQTNDAVVKFGNNSIPQENAKYLKHFDQTIAKLVQLKEFQTLMDTSDKYTKSILSILKENPRAAMRNSAPLFIKYDNEQFEAEYNKNFYLELPAVDNYKSWSGSIYASNGNGLPENILYCNAQALPNSNLPRYDIKDNAAFVQLPASWMMPNETKPYLFSMVQAGSRERSELQSARIVQQKGNTTEHIDVANFAAPFGNGDFGQASGNGRSLSFSTQSSNGAVLAKNMWVNGEWRLVYPLAKDLFWIKHYAQATKQAFTKGGKWKDNTYVTLDDSLQLQVQRYLFNQQQSNTNYKSRFGFAFSAVACDGDGNIKLMADIVNNRKKLDPNNQAAIDKLLKENYFFSSTRNERDQWANSNLIQLRDGPGSSIKPITFAAVASEVNAGWQSMNLMASNQFKYDAKTGKNAVFNYAGLDLGKKGWNEQHGGDNGNCNPVMFIESSNNFYHSLIVFLGAYPKNAFKKDTQRTYSLANILTTRSTGGSKYPLVSFNGTTQYFPGFNSGKWPKSSSNASHYFGNEDGIMAKALGLRFNLLTHDATKADYNLRTQKKVAFADAFIYDTLSKVGTEAFLYAFPEESYFLQKERIADEPLLNTLIGLRNPTAGGAPWEVSPLKMAEMYARLATQKNIVAHITPKDTKWKNLSVDSSWVGDSNYYNFLKQNIFTGMRNVLSGGSGTARPLGAQLGMSGGKIGDYFIYAKTGTIGNEGARFQNKRLAVIISKEDLTKVGHCDKVYTIYLSGQEIGSANYDLYAYVIRKVIESASFKQYMR